MPESRAQSGKQERRKGYVRAGGRKPGTGPSKQHTQTGKGRAQWDKDVREHTLSPSHLTCDAVHQHLPLMQLLFQLPDLSFLAPVSHCQL